MQFKSVVYSWNDSRPDGSQKGAFYTLEINSDNQNVSEILNTLEFEDGSSLVEIIEVKVKGLEEWNKVKANYPKVDNQADSGRSESWSFKTPNGTAHFGEFDLYLNPKQSKLYDTLKSLVREKGQLKQTSSPPMHRFEEPELTKKNLNPTEEKIETVSPEPDLSSLRIATVIYSCIEEKNGSPKPLIKKIELADDDEVKNLINSLHTSNNTSIHTLAAFKSSKKWDEHKSQYKLDSFDNPKREKWVFILSNVRSVEFDNLDLFFSESSRVDLDKLKSLMRKQN